MLMKNKNYLTRYEMNVLTLDIKKPVHNAASVYTAK